jgi:hypothetical protein
MQARKNGAKYFSLLTKNILAEKTHAKVEKYFSRENAC